MLAKYPTGPLKLLLLIFIGIVLVILAIAGWRRYARQEKKAPYKIGVIISPSDAPSGKMSVLKDIISRKLETINNQGGIDGHPLELVYLDDQNDNKKLYAQVLQTSQDPNLIAYVGCRGIARATTIGPLLTTKKIPLIGQYVFTDLTQKYPTMYTASVGTSDVKFITKELLSAKATKIGLIGEKSFLFSELVLKIVKDATAKNPNLKINVQRFFPKGYDFTSEKAESFLDSLKNNTDFVVVNVTAPNWHSLLAALAKKRINLPVYNLTSDFQQFDPTIPYYNNSELYAINTFGIPGAQNMELLENLIKYVPDVDLSPQGKWHLNAAARIADEIGWLKEISLDKSLPQDTGIRSRLNTGMKKYVNGGRVYRGWLTNWYFSPEHAYGGQPQLAWKPRNSGDLVLAPFQFVGTDSSFQKGQVLYTNLNMEEISRVNEDEGTFYATFYLEINSPENLDLKKLDFTNAARNEINHKALIETKLIRSKKDTLGFGFYNNLYKISGKFFFEPDLKKYPLDQQEFMISIQASNPSQVFLVQSAQKELHDSLFESKGWLYKNQFMGYDQDIISSVNNFRDQRINIQYYKFNYVYILKRAPIDFFLKTLVPLLAIIIISYFSVYIPPREFEALAGIQVTGLLSSIALYFSTYKPEMQYATISDKIFIFMYVMITTLLGTSILVYISHHKNSTITRLMRIYQRYLFPIIVLGFTVYIRWF